MPAEDDKFTPTDVLVIDGADAIKSLGEEQGIVRVGAYGLRFSDASQKDLTGDYFTKATDFGPRQGDGAPTMFNHGLPLKEGVKALEDVARMTFGTVKATVDDIGIFVETTLDTADQYQKAMYGLVRSGALKWSSGCVPNLLCKNADGQITRWHIAEFSYTPKPAEPRLPAIATLKSLPGEVPPEITAAFVDTTKAAHSQPVQVTHEPTMTAEEKAAAEKQAKDAIKTATDARVAEINEIMALGQHFKCVKEAGDFVSQGKSLNEFRTYVVEEVKKAKPIERDATIGMAKADMKKWSLVKAIREIAGNGFNHGALTGVEKEANEATIKSIKYQPKGFFIPHDVVVSHMAETHDLGALAVKALVDQAAARKNLNATSFTSGGALVGTNLLTGSMIELLRNKPLVAQMGARTLTGLVGNIAIPRLNQGATTYWLNEQGTASNSDQAFGQLGLTPKKLVGRTGYTKELMNQTDLSVEAIVRDDLTTVLGIAKDLAAINGSGGAQPLGILNTSGIGSVTFGAAATRLKAIEFQTDLASANASRGTLAYLTTPTVAGKWMGIAEAPNYPKWLWEGTVDEGVVVGRPAYSTNQVPSNKVIYGNWQDLILADWAGLDVVVNPYTNDAIGVINITIFLMTDVGVRQVVSFAVSADSGAQ